MAGRLFLPWAASPADGGRVSVAAWPFQRPLPIEAFGFIFSSQKRMRIVGQASSCSVETMFAKLPLRSAAVLGRRNGLSNDRLVFALRLWRRHISAPEDGRTPLAHL